MISLRVITELAGLAALAQDWQRLWALQPRPEVFMHLAWVRTFVEVYGPGRGLHCVVAESGGRVCGLLPLMRDDKGWLRFIGDPRSDYSDVLCAPEEAAAVVAALTAHLRKLPGLTLSAVPEHALLWQALNGMKHPFTIMVEEPCPAIQFDADGQVARDLLKKDSLRRHEKKVAKLGPITLQRAATRAEAHAFLPVLFDQHVARWRTTGTPSMFEKPEHRRFYERLIDDEVLWPLVDFRVVKAGERFVASHFGFFHDRRFIWYKPSFDPELSNLGPGEVLLKYLIAAAAEEGAVEFDFTRGNEGFKQRFATVIRQNYRIHRPTLIQRLRSVASRVRTSLRARAAAAR